jgi:hypothetical protein
MQLFKYYKLWFICFFKSSLFLNFGRQMILLNSCKFLSPSYCIRIAGAFNADPKRWNTLTTWQGFRWWILIECFRFSSKCEIAVPLFFCCFTSLNPVNVYWSMLSFVRSVASWVKWVVVYRGLPTKRSVARPKPIKDVPRPCPSTSYNLRTWVSWLCRKFL